MKKKMNEQISSESGATGNMQIKEDSEEYEGEKKSKTQEVEVEDVDKIIKEQVIEEQEDFTEVQVEDDELQDFEQMEGSFVMDASKTRDLDYIRADDTNKSPREGSFVGSRNGSFISDAQNKTTVEQEYRSNESIEDVEIGVFNDNAITFDEYKKSFLAEGENAEEEKK